MLKKRANDSMKEVKDHLYRSFLDFQDKRKSKKPLKLVITGVCGFLGQHLVKLISEELSDFIEVKGLYREEDKGLEALEGLDLMLCKTDYSYKDLAKHLEGAEALVHLAGRRTCPTWSDAEADVRLLDNLLTLAKDLAISSVCIMSSISVFGVDVEAQLPWGENLAPCPDNFYGAGKEAQEALVRVYRKKMGLNVVALRLTHLFGFNEKNNYMINYFLRRAANGLSLELMAKAIARREFLSAEDVARAILLTLSIQPQVPVLNIGSSEAYTNEDVAAIITEAFGRPLDYKILDETAKEGIHSSYLDSSLSYELLGSYCAKSFKGHIETIARRMENELETIPLRY